MTKLPQSAAALRRAHDALLFASAFPADPASWAGASLELAQLALQARRLAAGPRGTSLHNSGIAGTVVTAAFSLAITHWLVSRFGEAVTLASVEGDKSHVMTVLGATLDLLEQEVLSEQPVNWPTWHRRHLGTGGAQRLGRLLSLVERLPGDSVTRETIFASLRVYVRWRIAPDAPVLTTGRFSRGEPRFHPDGLQRRAQPEAAWREGKPRRVRLTRSDRRALVDLARGTMASLLSETDPFSHAQESEVELHDLGRGIRIALFATQPRHKLALEAYVGYLLLKNHLPVAYGGGWVLGRQSRFGLNVLPPFRGGESAVLLCQLLRLYAWRFGLRLFLVEPYQIGRNNPDGIRSGSFWFYWRLGFRPLQPDLCAMAESEARRLAGGAGRRTPPALLRRLADSTMAWETPAPGRWVPLDIARIGARVSAHVLERFDGDRDAAQRAAVRMLGFRDRRLAVLLAAIAPGSGWPAGDLTRLGVIMRLKDHHELRHAVALQAHGGLMKALATAAGLEG